MAQLLTFPCPFDALSFRSSNCLRFVTQVVGVLEEEVPDLIEVPKPLEHASVVGDHINFHLINPTPEENVAFQVKVMKRKVVCPTRVFFLPRNVRGLAGDLSGWVECCGDVGLLLLDS